MPDTFQAVAVFVVALMPGALYTWSFERIVGRWGISLADRVLRFVGASAFFHVLVAPASYWLYSEYVRSGRIEQGRPVSWLLWLVPLVYVTLPTAIGTSSGARRETAASGPR